ncbi:hypothetical protein AAMO2058_001045500 [Amorphochlora amoebiformis]
MSFRTASLKLYRNMMREAKHFKDYNFREYILRRVRTQFHRKMNVKDPQEAELLVQKGEETLGIIRRQKTIDNLYSSGGSVMEKIQFHPILGGIG